MTGLLIFLLIVGAVCLAIWGNHKYGIFSSTSSTPVQDSYTLPPPAAPEPRYMDVTLSLPSKDVFFQFTSVFRVSIMPSLMGPGGHMPPKPIVESALYSAAKGRASKLALPQKDQLRHELDSLFQSPQQLPPPNANVRITATCTEVRVDPKQLEAIERNYQEDLDAERLQRKVSYLSAVFESPKVATMWWLAQHVDEIDQLPDKASLLYRLDRRFNPDNSRSERQVTRDLDWFLERAGDAERSAVGAALSGIYKRFGYDDYADEAKRLVAGEAVPPRNGVKVDGADTKVPTQRFE